ncbi:hypothetical protein AK812_SmicGene38943 [Symbiodinium microadriaticum]|uniref:J domain-containing protein n=1 Tax=Symbiodinium microadriaticum TaxID=2951 RepID=A0A1Q9CCH2_SYMMI|nr:hypothetical protein AK812_SmicGene38943 [Symbiodinium microadriaticum]
MTTTPLQVMTLATTDKEEHHLLGLQALEKLMKLKEVEPRENRLKEFRILLRKWHPDKNPDQQEVATAVFQFLQKGKLLIESS